MSSRVIRRLRAEINDNHHNSDDDDDDDDDDEQQQMRRRRMATLLSKSLASTSGSNKRINKSTSESKQKQIKKDNKTSIGTRRIGSASKARNQQRTKGIGNLLRSVRTSAAAAATLKQKSSSPSTSSSPSFPEKEKDSDENKNKKMTKDRLHPQDRQEDQPHTKQRMKSTTTKVKSILSSKKSILSTIDSLIEAQKKVKCTSAAISSTASSSSRGSVLQDKDEKEDDISTTSGSHPNSVQSSYPLLVQGATLIPHKKIFKQTKKSTMTSQSTQSQPPVSTKRKNMKDYISLHVAATTTATTSTSTTTRTDNKPKQPTNYDNADDDTEIANLRLSVFSDYDIEQRKHWIDRSCEVLNQRREKGAICLVAFLNYQLEHGNDSTTSITTTGDDDDDDDDGNIQKWMVGSIEGSTHEFMGTHLEKCRPNETIMYISEVAVSPKARRRGVGEMLMKGIDKLATIRNVETLYLHVDVSNIAACSLYQKAGYDVLDLTDPIYDQFTTKLNLHDFATKGRKHHLMSKKMTKKQTWLSHSSKPTEFSKRGVLGFEIPELV